MDYKLFIRCLFSPSLYTIHRGNSAHVGKYDSNDWERWGDNLILSFVLFRNLTIYTSPLLMFVLCRRGYFTAAGAFSLAKISLGLGVLVGASYCLRSFGRINSSKYKSFLHILQKAEDNYSTESQYQLKSYDFDFKNWPVDFTMDTSQGIIRKRSGVAKRSWFNILSPCSLLSYVVLHTFGIRLIYPGSIQFIGFLMKSVLDQGRNRLVVNENGERFKLKTKEGNFIDAMFIDKRKNNVGINGRTLVICSEGNAGFYEIGIMVTPLEAGYSILGWNHPGFGGSTGMPYPEEEENAIDVVLQFAIHKLNFKIENIVLFGWSIGGYTTSWAAMNYPDVKAVVIDASFDDLLPLAIPRMPLILEPIVRRTIRHHANLDVARKLTQYPGPILIVRRSEDEVICLEPNNLSTNRGNYLLKAILQQRYPKIFSKTSEAALREWMSVSSANQGIILEKHKVNVDRCKQIIESYLGISDHTFPYDIGDGLEESLKTQLLLYFASKYMIDYASTHCTPLPGDLFRVPTNQSDLFI